MTRKAPDHLLLKSKIVYPLRKTTCRINTNSQHTSLCLGGESTRPVRYWTVTNKRRGKLRCGIKADQRLIFLHLKYFCPIQFNFPPSRPWGSGSLLLAAAVSPWGQELWLSVEKESSSESYLPLLLLSWWPTMLRGLPMPSTTHWTWAGEGLQ